MKKKLTNKIAKLLSILLMFQLIAFNAKPVFAASNTIVSYTVTGTPEIGNTIEIAVNISNVKDLYGGSIDFIYDPNVLQVESITKGNIFGTSEVLTPIGENGKLSDGEASFALTLKGNKPGVYADGTIAVIKAKILKEGSVELNTTSSNDSLSLTGNTVRVKLVSASITPINYSAINEVITIDNNSVPLAAGTYQDSHEGLLSSTYLISSFIQSSKSILFLPLTCQ